MAHPQRASSERAAESKRLIEELSSLTEELNSWEKDFVSSMDERLTKYGEGAYVSDNQFDKLSEIYRRIIG